MQEQRLNDEVFEALATRGYVIVHNYFPEAQRSAMAAALRPHPQTLGRNRGRSACRSHRLLLFPLSRTMPQPRHRRPRGHRLCPPLARHRPNTLSAPDWVWSPIRAARVGRSTSTMATTRCCRPLNPTVATANSTSGFASKMSKRIRPRPSSSPMATASTQDAARAEPMVAPGGSVAIFHNYSWHAASDYRRRRWAALYLEICLWSRRPLLGRRRALHPRRAQPALLRVYRWSLRRRPPVFPLPTARPFILPPVRRSTPWKRSILDGTPAANTGLATGNNAQPLRGAARDLRAVHA